MAYSKDLRSRVLAYVAKGGSKAEAVRLFGVSKAIVFVWLKTPHQVETKKTGPKGSWKLDIQALQAKLKARPDSYQSELASALGVTPQAICIALKKLKISRKKNASLPRKKRHLS
jgi:transposase